MRYLPDFFEKQEHVKDVKKFVNSCVYCKVHEHGCINSIDLSLLLPAIKSDLSKIESNYVWAPQNILTPLSRVLSSDNFYRFWRNLNYKLVPLKFRERFEEYRKPKKREVVFFSGCGIQLLENQYYVLLEIFKKLGVDFGLVDGSYLKPVCCGAVHCEVGNFEYGTYMLKNLIREIKKFKTKKVIVYCATCYFGLTTLAPELIEDFDLEVVHATRYLSEYITENASLIGKSSAPRIAYTIHDSCHLAHGCKGDPEGIRNLISMLPNAQILEMKHNKKNSLCDASFLLMNLRNPISMILNKNTIPIINEAQETKADVLCSLCPGCHAVLTIFGFDIPTLLGNKQPRVPVKNWVSILGNYLGIKQKDMLTYRFKHIISFSLRDSGLWFIIQAFKAIVRGYFSKKEPKPIELKLNQIRKKTIKS